MVLDSQTQTISLILQDQRGTQLFLAPDSGWQKEVDELERRRSLARQMGGAEQVARQHEHGKLTARERLAALADEGSFREFGGLAGSGTYQDGQLASFTPKGEVTGFVSIGGRQAVVAAGDFTVRGGSGRGPAAGSARS